MDHVRDHSPKMRFVFFVQGNGGVVGVFGQKPGFAFGLVKALDRKLAVERDDDHLAVRRLDTPVDHEQVAIMNSGVDHGIAPGPHEKGGARFMHEVGVQIERSFEVIVGRGRETGGNSACVQRQGILFALYETQDALDLAFRNAYRPGRLTILVAALGTARSFSFSSSCVHFLKIVTLFKKVKKGKTNFDPSKQPTRSIWMDQIVKQDSFTHLIAGASKGIGRALLNSCVDKGEQAIALSRSQPDPLPAGCQWITADVRQPENFADELPEVIHRLTFCPGKVILGPLKRISPEQVLEAYQTNVVDAFGLIQALLPKLTDSSIVLISSVAAGTGLPNHCAISAAKAGLEGLALALAADLAPKTRVNVVAPTLTPTEMGLAMVGGEKMIPMIENRHPLKRLPSVKEIADTISFLHSSSAASITGQVFKVDGGLSHLRTS